jgi:hypothetical protein
MGRDKRNEQRGEQFTKMVRAQCALPAFKALTCTAQIVYHHLKMRCFAETKSIRNNNGEVYASPRDLAKNIGCDRKSVMRAFADLQAKGWVHCTRHPEMGFDGAGETAHWRLTMLATGDGRNMQPPTGEPYRWKQGHDYPVIAYQSFARSSSKKQNPGPILSCPRAQKGSETDNATPLIVPKKGPRKAIPA